MLPSDASDRLMPQLLELFRSAETPPEAQRVGIEVERFGINRAWTGQGEPFATLEDIHRLFARLEAADWRPKREWPEGPTIAMQRDATSITLEPGAQLELSGAPYGGLEAIARELDTVWAQLKNNAALDWLACGFHPLATRAQLPKVPKLRYPIMANYFPSYGTRGLDMMWRTCTTQINLDYASESEAAEKFTLAAKLQPFVTALCANSPWYEGAHRGRLCERAAVWLDVDASRTGLVEDAWQGRAKGGFYRAYAQWALNARMFFLQRNAATRDMQGARFAALIDGQLDGMALEPHDWPQHLGTLFPEVRLKTTLECRGADAMPRPYIVALAALWRGLLDAPSTRAALLGYSASWSAEDVLELRQTIPEHAIHGVFRGTALRATLENLVEHAAQGLEALDEPRCWLAPFVALLESGQTLSERLLAELGERPDAASLAAGYEALDTPALSAIT